jgi:hypothetical protein
VTSSIARLRTVGLILGPYRNLTTLTASVLSLHPECQALNHAGPRLLKGRSDFIKDVRRLDRFCEAALEASTSGRRHDHGGSIQFSHAFDRKDMQQLYHDRFGDRVIKDDVRVLVWKESGLVTERIREKPERIIGLLEDEPRLRFLMPVRHPFDCAQSNIRTGHSERIPGADPTDAASIVDRIVEMIGWFGGLMETHPDRFFLFFQNDKPELIADGFIRTLELTDDRQWRDALDTVFAVKGKEYQYPPELFDALDVSVDRYLSELPEIARKVSDLVRG